MAIQGLYPFTKRWHDEPFTSGHTVWIISDPHFGDEELRAGVPNRPTDEELVKKINSKVGRKDTLIILGDCGDREYIKKLRGYKVLVMGNHDAGSTTYKKKWYYEDYSETLSRSEALARAKAAHPDCVHFELTNDNSYYNNDWDVRMHDGLFDEIYEGPVMISEKLILSHEPINVPWAFNIHGHIHDKKHKNDKYHFNVCADVIDYTPINFNQWMKQGYLAKIETIHRDTIDKATERKKKRGAK